MATSALRASFQVMSKDMEVTFDAGTQQQMLSFRLALQVPVAELLQMLVQSSTMSMNETMDSPGGVQVPRADVSQRQVAGYSGSEWQVPQQSPKLMHRAFTSAATCGDRQMPQLQAPPVAHRSSSAAGIDVVSHAPPNLVLQSQMQAPAAVQDIFTAVRSGNIANVRSQLREGQVDVNKITTPQGSSLLHMAILAGSSVGMVKMLLESRCSVNASRGDGNTALHLATSQLKVTPLVVRLLLASQANPQQPDQQKITPIANIKAWAEKGEVGSSMRQIMDEVLHKPTQDVAVMTDNAQVIQVCFADAAKEHVAFLTKSSIGLYSIAQRKVIFQKNLSKNQDRDAEVISMAVNPLLGTTVVFLEVKTASSHGSFNIVMVWPHGLNDEEVLSIDVHKSSGNPQQGLPPCVLLSTSSHRPTLLARTREQQVLVWRMNTSCCQIVSESLLTPSGGLMALSGEGSWLALDTIGGWIQVMTFESGTGEPLPHPKLVSVIRRKPSAMAVMSNSPGSCFVVIAPEVPEMQMADVLRVGLSGSLDLVKQVPLEFSSPCLSLTFGQQDTDVLMGVLSEGKVFVWRISQGSEPTFAHEDEAVRNVDLSPDCNLMVSSLGDAFRIFTVN
eukprot:TRINITY_DN50765_c0_g1_i1.p1 TRINITY_DN50765_c0_g1~~TRINITY_DN50765_c0_g1_i1.p1  ORF type:complete len:616 (-),score=106.79 TRINITY_DN50765_c0_g1_i1:47-1894(-)